MLGCIDPSIGHSLGKPQDLAFRTHFFVSRHRNGVILSHSDRHESKEYEAKNGS